MAQVDYFLELDGIKGESTDDKFKGKIDIESFSLGATNATHGQGAGRGAGKATFQDIHFTTPVNSSSPLLMLACATGQHIKKGILHVRKAGGTQQEYYTITLEDVLVSSYTGAGHGTHDRSGQGTNPVPMDQFSLNFVKIKFEYKPQKPDGSLDAAVTGGWDIGANKKL